MSSRCDYLLFVYFLIIIIILVYLGIKVYILCYGNKPHNYDDPFHFPAV